MQTQLDELFPFVKKMETRQYDKFIKSIQFLKVTKGTEMISEQGRCGSVPMIMAGRIRIYKMSVDGREITLYKINEGEMCLLAAMCILGQADYDVIAEVEENGIICMVPPTIFLELMSTSLPWQQYIFSSMANQLINSMETIGSVAFLDTGKRIIHYLLNCKDINNDIILATHEKIAMEIGTAREVVSRKLNNLQKTDIVKLERGKIHILDRKSLESLLS